MNDVDKRIEQWLRQAGLAFHPFRYLEASQDEHLLRFLVIYEGLERAWEEGSALVVAPVGGGKTALRHYVTWTSQRGWRTFFPVPYFLPRHWDHLPPADIAAQARVMGQAVARSLLLHWLTLPQAFLELSSRAQRELCARLWQVFPEMPFVAARWRDLTASADPAAAWRRFLGDLTESAQMGGYAPPPLRYLREVGEPLARGNGRPYPSTADNPNRLTDLLETVRGVYEAGLLFLMDGLDAFPETADGNGGHNRGWMQSWLTRWQAELPAWVQVKVFVPPSWAPDDLPPGIGRVDVRWTPALLAEVIRRRIAIATDNEFDSLDAIADAGIRHFEQTLAHTTVAAGRPLPREMIALTRRVLIEHVLARPNDPLLRGEDVYAAQRWYTTGQSVGSRNFPRYDDVPLGRRSKS
ncbi:MAG: hypothetical protein RMN24_13870 [Anaerolineae bacterium]|nr:hypothetical protein [Anaerolineae bacterium]